MNTIGERIADLRNRRGLTQTELGDAIGESKQTIYKYEHGVISNIPLQKVELIAQALHCSPVVLTGWDLGNTSECLTPIENKKLSTDESRLIEDYRQLSQEGKMYIRQTMALAIQSYSEKNDALSDMDSAQ